MPRFLLKRWHGLHMIWTFVFVAALVVVLFVFNWIIAAAALLISALLGYYTLKAEKAFQKDLNHYIGTVSQRVKKAGITVVNDLPIGIALYTEEKTIEWHNAFVSTMLGKESVIGEPLYEIFPALKNRKDKETKFDAKIGKLLYQVIVKPEERQIYFRDVTAYDDLLRRYQDEKIAIGIVMMDNLDEATQGMDDQNRSILLAKVTGEINEWAMRHQLYLRRTASDRYLIFMNQKSLQQLEQTRFEILDEVRECVVEQKVPFTLSIGIAAGFDNLIEIGQMAQTSLDMALGRGGDQVAVKIGQRISFYGGRTNAIEKRTRVRARVISHALRDLIKESDKVIIMGHKNPDGCDRRADRRAQGGTGQQQGRLYSARRSKPVHSEADGCDPRG